MCCSGKVWCGGDLRWVGGDSADSWSLEISIRILAVGSGEQKGDAVSGFLHHLAFHFRPDGNVTAGATAKHTSTSTSTMGSGENILVGLQMQKNKIKTAHPLQIHLHFSEGGAGHRGHRGIVCSSLLSHQGSCRFFYHRHLCHWVMRTEAFRGYIRPFSRVPPPPPSNQEGRTLGCQRQHQKPSLH